MLAFLLLSCVLLLPLAACGGASSSSSNSNQGISENVQVVIGPNGATAVLLPVTINGKGPYTFELDTGASVSLIAASLAQQLGLPVAGSPQAITGIGGVTQSTPVTISNWSTGPIHLPKMTIASAPIPSERGAGIQGLVGSDIWSQFGKFTLDYSNGTLTVYKQIALAPIDWRLALVSLSR